MHTHKNFSVSGDPTNIYNAYKKKFNVLSLCLAGSIFFPTIEKEKTALPMERAQRAECETFRI